MFVYIYMQTYISIYTHTRHPYLKGWLPLSCRVGPGWLAAGTNPELGFGGAPIGKKTTEKMESSGDLLGFSWPSW